MNKAWNAGVGPAANRTIQARLLIAAHLPVLRSGLGQMLGDAGSSILVADSFHGLLATIDTAVGSEVGLIVIDLALPGLDGIRGLARLRAVRRLVPLLVICEGSDPALVGAAAAAGAGGVVSYASTADQIREAAACVLSGRSYFAGDSYAELGLGRSAPDEPGPGEIEARIARLTPRQREVLSLLSLGRSNKEIARALDLSEATIKVHVYAIFHALGVHRRMEALAMLSRLRHVPAERRGEKRQMDRAARECAGDPCFDFI